MKEIDTCIVDYARKFAQETHKNHKRRDGITTYLDNLEGVVNRLKNLGVTNNNVLCAAWLHNILENKDITFDQINERFGREVAVTVMSLTKDENISKKNSEIQYVNQLKNAVFSTKIIKLCDISTNLKDLANAPLSKTQKNKQCKIFLHYLRVIKSDISKNKSTYPKVQEIIDGINTICIKFNQKPIVI